MAKAASRDPAPVPPEEGKSGKKKRPYVKQTDVPSCSLREALRIPQTIANQYGKQPTRPLDIATALQVLPSSRGFRMAAGAALAYGVTDAGAKADLIGLTDLGRRIVASTEDGDDHVAMQEAFLRPRVVHEFLEKYDGSRVPSVTVGRNVLEQMGVAAEATARVFELIVSGAEELGMLAEINGHRLVNLPGPNARGRAAGDDPAEHDEDDAPASQLATEDEEPKGDDTVVPLVARSTPQPPQANRRVFITHGGNLEIVKQAKELLTYGDFVPVVAEEKETTARPVPKKVLDAMRSCGSGIVHVGRERTNTDADGNEHHLLNDNVLVEIGVAMALWDENFILLVEEGTKRPSNLQGLYEVRYRGAALDYEATMKLLRAFRDFKAA
jgi:hypothetical protein